MITCRLSLQIPPADAPAVRNAVSLRAGVTEIFSPTRRIQSTYIRMKRHFIVHLKRGTPRDVWAYGFTEDTTRERIFFHMKSDLSDRSSYFVASEVVGVTELEPLVSAADSVPTEDEFRAFLHSRLAKPSTNETDSKT